MAIRASSSSSVSFLFPTHSFIWISFSSHQMKYTHKFANLMLRNKVLAQSNRVHAPVSRRNDTALFLVDSNACRSCFLSLNNVSGGRAPKPKHHILIFLLLFFILSHFYIRWFYCTIGEQSTENETNVSAENKTKNTHTWIERILTGKDLPGWLPQPKNENAKI